MILERRMHRIEDVRYSLTPIALIVGTTAGLILVQPDMGTAVSLLLIVAVMVFAAGLPYRYIGWLAAAAVPVRLRAAARGVPVASRDGLPQSVGRPARRRLLS
jgi:cell division protein FtsW (lipid II flippase)